MDFRRPDRADLERVKLYKLEREQQRRAAATQLGPVALDVVDLLQALALGDTSARGNVLKRRALARCAVDHGANAAQLGEVWGLTPDEVSRDLSADLLDMTGRAAAIDRGLAERFPDVVEGYSLADRTARGGGARA